MTRSTASQKFVLLFAGRKYLGLPICRAVWKGHYCSCLELSGVLDLPARPGVCFQGICCTTCEHLVAQARACVCFSNEPVKLVSACKVL